MTIEWQSSVYWLVFKIFPALSLKYNNNYRLLLTTAGSQIQFKTYILEAK